MKTGRLFLAVFLLSAFAEAGSAQGSAFDAALLGNISDVQVPLPPPAPDAVYDKAAPVSGGPVLYEFRAKSFPDFYDARRQTKGEYNVPQILIDIPKMWKSYGALFKEIGMAMEMDPYAMAAYCVYESYNEKKHNFNPRHLDDTAAGLASTQVQHVKGGIIPGLKIRLPRSEEQSATLLRNNPGYSLRYLAAEFKAWYLGGDHFKKFYSERLYNKLFPGGFDGYHDLAKSFPRVARPAWTDPDYVPNKEYGNQAQYVSRAYAFYNAFRAADAK